MFLAAFAHVELLNNGEALVEDGKYANIVQPRRKLKGSSRCCDVHLPQKKASKAVAW